jgi:hypothetical protein
MPQGSVDDNMSSTELCGIEAFYVDTCWILNAMPSTGPCGIEVF